MIPILAILALDLTPFLLALLFAWIWKRYPDSPPQGEKEENPASFGARVRLMLRDRPGYGFLVCFLPSAALTSLGFAVLSAWGAAEGRGVAVVFQASAFWQATVGAIDGFAFFFGMWVLLWLMGVTAARRYFWQTAVVYFALFGAFLPRSLLF